MSFHINDQVRIARDIYRMDGPNREMILYACKDDVGTIIDIFKSSNYFHYAKVVSNGKCLTLRLTSLKRVV